MESIHDMRVEIKKLRAFLNLLEWINSDFPTKKTSGPVIRLFKSAGKIRDVHVQQQIARHWINQSNLEISEYCNHLKQLETKNEGRFRMTFKGFKNKVFNDIWDKIDATLEILPENFIRFKTEERFYFLVNKLIDFKNKERFSGEDYHEIRKLSKETRYALEILHQCSPKIDRYPELDQWIRDIHRALGKWHDDEIALLTLNYYLENLPTWNFFSPDSYTQFITLLEEEKMEWLSKFEDRWRSFMDFLSQKGLLPTLIGTNFSPN